jgi:hypothetical protein
LRQDVKELTALLRDDPVLEGLREALRANGFEPNEVLLAGFMEDEEENEYGAFVTPAGGVFEYERRTASSAPKVFTSLVRVRDVQDLINHRYPAIRVALEACGRVSRAKPQDTP